MSPWTVAAGVMLGLPAAVLVVLIVVAVVFAALDAVLALADWLAR